MPLVGFNFPFLLRGGDVLPPQAETRLIKNDLKQLLLTSPKERRMRSSFGTDIRKFPFQPFDQRALNELKASIRNAIDRFEPRVKLRDVVLSGNPDEHFLVISVIVALTRNPNIELSVELTTASPQAIAPTQQQVL
jgi:phage baseplate assembly protein W